jgi:WD40 repeat protein
MKKASCASDLIQRGWCHVRKVRYGYVAVSGNVDFILNHLATDRSVHVYSFPELEFQCRLDGHTAAVNAVSISESIIVSASGDRSVKLWDAKTGSLLRTLNNHHSRGYCQFPSCSSVCLTSCPYRIASIDFNPPMIMSGSSDKHIRLFDITNFQGWATSPDYDASLPSTTAAAVHASALAPLSFSANGTQETGTLVCQACGSSNIEASAQSNPAIHRNGRCVHTDLVRSVALGDEFVVSGSYDISIKVRPVTASLFTSCSYSRGLTGVGSQNWCACRRSHSWTCWTYILYWNGFKEGP